MKTATSSIGDLDNTSVPLDSDTFDNRTEKINLESVLLKSSVPTPKLNWVGPSTPEMIANCGYNGVRCNPKKVTKGIITGPPPQIKSEELDDESKKIFNENPLLGYFMDEYYTLKDGDVINQVEFEKIDLTKQDLEKAKKMVKSDETRKVKEFVAEVMKLNQEEEDDEMEKLKEENRSLREHIRILEEKINKLVNQSAPIIQPKKVVEKDKPKWEVFIDSKSIGKFYNQKDLWNSDDFTKVVTSKYHQSTFNRLLNREFVSYKDRVKIVPL